MSRPRHRARYWAFGVMIVAAAAQAIFRNKMRSALTMLGVFIGVAALIAMVAVGQGANDAVRKQIESLGTNLLVVLPGATTSGGVASRFWQRLDADGSATSRRSGARRRRSASVSYLIRQIGQVQYGNQNWTTSIQGVSYNYPPITNWQIATVRRFHRMTKTRPRWWSCWVRRCFANCSAPTKIPSVPSSRSRAYRCASSGFWRPKAKRRSVPIRTTLS